MSSIKTRTNKPKISSFLFLTTGVLGIFTAVILASSNDTITSQLGLFKSLFSDFNNVILSVLIIICSLFAFIGSFFSFRRKYIRFTMICSIISIFSIGLFFGTVFSVITLILLFLSRDEFENASKGKIF